MHSTVPLDSGRDDRLCEIASADGVRLDVAENGTGGLPYHFQASVRMKIGHMEVAEEDPIFFRERL